MHFRDTVLRREAREKSCERLHALYFNLREVQERATLTCGVGGLNAACVWAGGYWLQGSRGGPSGCWEYSVSFLVLFLHFSSSLGLLRYNRHDFFPASLGYSWPTRKCSVSRIAVHISECTVYMYVILMQTELPRAWLACLGLMPVPRAKAIEDCHFTGGRTCIFWEIAPSRSAAREGDTEGLMGSDHLGVWCVKSSRQWGEVIILNHY